MLINLTNQSNQLIIKNRFKKANRLLIALWLISLSSLAFYNSLQYGMNLEAFSFILYSPGEANLFCLFSAALLLGSTAYIFHSPKGKQRSEGREKKKVLKASPARATEEMTDTSPKSERSSATETLPSLETERPPDSPLLLSDTRFSSAVWLPFFHAKGVKSSTPPPSSSLYTPPLESDHPALKTLPWRPTSLLKFADEYAYQKLKECWIDRGYVRFYFSDKELTVYFGEDPYRLIRYVKKINKSELLKSFFTDPSSELDLNTTNCFFHPRCPYPLIKGVVLSWSSNLTVLQLEATHYLDYDGAFSSIHKVIPFLNYKLREPPSDFDVHKKLSRWMKQVFDQGYQGILIGEHHDEDLAHHLILDNLSFYKSTLGITTICIEGINYDADQITFDQHRIDMNNIRLKPRMQFALSDLDNSLVNAIHKAGMRTLALDTITCFNPLQVESVRGNRVREFTMTAKKIIEAELKPKDRYLLLCGRHHTATLEYTFESGQKKVILGLGTILNQPILLTNTTERDELEFNLPTYSIYSGAVMHSIDAILHMKKGSRLSLSDTQTT